MDNKKVRTFANIISAIFIGVIIYLIVGISSQIHNGNNYAKKIFANTVINLKQVEDTFGYMSNEYKNVLNVSVENNPIVCSVIVTGKDNISYAYPLNSKLIQVNSNGTVSFSIPSSIMKVFTTNFDNGNTNLSMVMYLITPTDIFRQLRISFLIVLLCTLLTVIILIFLDVNSKQPDSSEGDNLQNTESVPDATFDLDVGTLIEDDFIPPASDLIEPIEVVPENDDEKDSSTSKESLNNNISDPLEVYSLNSGLSQEKDLGSRLDSELTKAASTEYDVSLLLFQIKGITHQDIEIKNIAEVLLKIYNKKDLIFEYKDNAFAILILDTNLNDTMTLAEKFHSAVKEFLYEKNIKHEIGVGISTRSIRIIPSSRLLLEAEQALDKSFEEKELPIVAFQVDPEKYRQCLKDTV